jgi:putative ABC transport system permease protein
MSPRLVPIDAVFRDTRYAIRTLRRSPAFTAAAIVTLALGIGANAAIFSVVNAVLLKPLPYAEPERLVQLVRRNRVEESEAQTGRRYLFFRDHLQSVTALAATSGLTGFNLATGDSAEFVRAMLVSKEFFDVLGERPLYGGTFLAEHDLPNGPSVAVLSHALWQRLFGGNPQVVGSTIQLGDQSSTVLGVMPASFVTFPHADLYIPLRPALTGRGGGYNYRVIGRLKPGVTREQANAEAASVWYGLRDAYPETLFRSELPSGMVQFRSSTARDSRLFLLVLLGAVMLLLLIACANTASLLLARASSRTREIAVRAALGASRARIVQQLLTESVILSIAGTLIGMLIAYLTVPMLLAMTPAAFAFEQDVRVDATVLGVMLTAAVITGLLFGLAPAIGVARHDLGEAFKDDGARSSGSGRAAWFRGTLVIVEIALCMVLLVGAGLLARTFINMRAIDPGFDPRGVLRAQMSLQGSRHATPEDINQFFDQGLERLRRIPGVRSAAIVSGVPIERGLNLNVDILDGPERLDDQLTDWRYASPNYFSTMGIRIVAGRGFEERDRMGAPPVAVVNETFAQRLFKGVNPIGRHIRVYDTDGEIEIVGIATDVREQGLIRRLPVVMYVPIAQANPAGVRTTHSYFPMSWVVRADNPGPALIQEMRDTIRALDPKQPFSSFSTMEEIKSESMATQTFGMTLVGSFAIVGLLLASAGVYGLVAYSAAQRTREFGIRLALGATPSHILWSVISSGALLALIGVAVGLVASYASVRVLEGFIWGVSTLDPSTFVTVAVTLVAVAITASLVPAIRAVRLNPLSTLRQ